MAGNALVAVAKFLVVAVFACFVGVLFVAGVKLQLASDMRWLVGHGRSRFVSLIASAWPSRHRPLAHRPYRSEVRP
jgi:hypothetical protein